MSPFHKKEVELMKKSFVLLFLAIILSFPLCPAGAQVQVEDGIEVVDGYLQITGRISAIGEDSVYIITLKGSEFLQKRILNINPRNLKKLDRIADRGQLVSIRLRPEGRDVRIVEIIPR